MLKWSSKIFKKYLGAKGLVQHPHKYSTLISSACRARWPQNLN